MFGIILVAPWLGAGLLAFGSSVASNAWNAREASKNRKFQERMSSTAHQREVKDLRAANVNPMARSMAGSSTPAGDRAEMEDSGGKGISSALAVKMQKAQIKLVEAQAGLAADQALEARYRSGRMNMEVNAGLFDRLVAERNEAVQRAELSKLTTEQMREMVPIALDRARAEVEQLSSSAEAARARAALDRAAETGALNEQEFERWIGELGPGLKFFVNLLRGIRR